MANNRIPANLCDSQTSCQKICSDDKYVSGGWHATTNNAAQYAQVDFGKLQYISGLETKGLQDPKLAYWVKKYKISWSRDNSAWNPYQTAGYDTYHWGNTAQTRGVTHEFTSPFWARYIRIHVDGWSSAIGMQAQFHGYTAGHPSTITNPSVHPQFRQARFKTCPSGIFLYKGDGSHAKLTANWELPSAEDTAGTVESGRELIDGMLAPRSTTWPVIDHADSMTVSHNSPLMLSPSTDDSDNGRTDVKYTIKDETGGAVDTCTFTVIARGEAYATDSGYSCPSDMHVMPDDSMYGAIVKYDLPDGTTGATSTSGAFFRIGTTEVTAYSRAKKLRCKFKVTVANRVSGGHGGPGV